MAHFLMKSGGTPKEQARRRTEVDIYNDVIFFIFLFLTLYHNFARYFYFLVVKRAIM